MSTSQNIIAHLIELRKRLLYSVVSLLLVFFCLFPVAVRYDLLPHGQRSRKLRRK